MFKVLGEKEHLRRILYLMKLSFKSEGEIRTFSNNQKLREFVASRSALQEMLKRSSSEEKENYVRNSDIQKEGKGIKEGMSEGKTKIFYFPYS